MPKFTGMPVNAAWYMFPDVRVGGVKRNLGSRVDRPAEVSTSQHDLGDGFMRNIRKMQLEAAWVNEINKIDNAGHGGAATNLLNTAVLWFRHAPYTVAHYILYGGVVSVLAGAAVAATVALL